MFVSIKDLKSALLCVADDREVRTYLQGVYLNGNEIAATNGHIAYYHKSSIENDKESSFIAVIDANDIKSFLKKVNKEITLVEITLVESDKVELKAIDLDNNMVSDVVEHTTYYVDYKRSFGLNSPVVVESDTKSIMVNLDYMTILSKINKLVRKRNKDMPKLHFSGDLGMITATWSHDEDLKFFMMPMRQ